jgi:hypothetical protein
MGLVPGLSSTLNWYLIANCSAVDQATDTFNVCRGENSIRAIDFLSVDTKIDNGNISSGNLFASGNSYGAPTLPYNMDDDSTLSDNSWATSNSENRVAGFIRMTSSGNPK